MISAVLGDAQLPRFNPFLIDSTGSPLQQQCFGRNDAQNSLPPSLVDPNGRRSKLHATSSLAHGVVRGTSPGNQYQEASEDRIDLLIQRMKDDHPVDIAEKLTIPWALRDLTKDPNVPQCYRQLVAWITWQNELATYLRVVDSCLASISSTDGNSPLPRFALIDSPLDELSWDNCMTFAKIEGHLMVTLITMNKTVMVDDTDNEID